MSNVIIHEYFYTDGPQSYEYPVGCSIPVDHFNCFEPFVRDVVKLHADQIREQLATQWLDIHPIIEPIASYLLSMEVCSFVFTESSGGSCPSWIVFRGSHDQQLLLGSPGKPSDEISNSAWINKIPGVRQLLIEFGNLQVDMIPPCEGFYIGDRLVHEADDQLCWGKTGTWENALPFYHDCAGNSICVSTDGEIGIWSPHQFQSIADSLSAFVTMFLSRRRSGKSPEEEWWW